MKSNTKVASIFSRYSTKVIFNELL